jgi:hypothetical protein
MTNFVVAFRNFAKPPKIVRFAHGVFMSLLYNSDKTTFALIDLLLQRIEE